MPYRTDDIIYKLNELIQTSQDFHQEIQHDIDNIRHEIDRLNTAIRNLAGNNNDTTVSQAESHELITAVEPQVSTRAYGDGERPRLLGFIRETMDLVEQRDNSELAKLRKRESASKILIRLNNLTLAVCEGVNAKVEEDKSLNHATMTWGKVPAKYKEFAVPLLIDMAKKSFIPLDRSEENWAPKLLLARRYHNKFNKKKIL
ncbi:unnamed protein product [Rhizopus stolonifer]